jgi:DNA polymerase sigma
MRRFRASWRAEIVEFCRFLEPTEEEGAARAAATARVAGVVTTIWPDAVVEAFGSYATGLYLPTSDMDLVVTNSGEAAGRLHCRCACGASLISILPCTLSRQVGQVTLMPFLA